MEHPWQRRWKDTDKYGFTFRRAREVAGEFAASLLIEELPYALWLHMEAMEELGNAMVPALEEALVSAAGRVKVLLAGALLIIDEAVTVLTPDESAAARGIVAHALSNDGDTQHCATSAVALGIPIPGPTLARLATLLESGDRRTAVFAGVAMLNDEEIRNRKAHLNVSEAMRVVRLGLRIDCPFAASQAAATLLRFGSRKEAGMGVGALQNMLQSTESQRTAYYALRAVRICGAGIPALAQGVRHMLAESSHDQPLRAFAAEVLGAIGDDDDLDYLMEVAAGDEHPVARGAIKGIARAVTTNERVFRLVVAHLAHEDAWERRGAAAILGSDPNAAKRAFPELLARVGVELDYDVVEAVTLAMAKCGETAGDMLLGTLASRNIAAMTTVGMTLPRMGVAGVRVLLRAMKDDPAPELRMMLLIMLRDVGDAAIACVKELGEALLQVEDEDQAVVIIEAISRTGRGAFAALRELIAVAVSRDGEVADRAEAAVRSMGPDAADAIREAMQGAGVKERERLTRMLAWLPSASGDRRRRLEALKKDEWLLSWLHAAEVWKDKGAMSMDSVVRELRSRKDGGEPLSVPSKATLARMFQDLVEKVMGGRRIKREDRSGRTELTPLGRELALDVRIYLFERGLIGRFKST